MQRRAAAAYTALFLVIAVVAGGIYATAEAPEVTVDDPDYELVEGDEFEHDGTTYTLNETADGEATFEVFEPEHEYTESWANGTMIEYEEGMYLVSLDPPTVILGEIVDMDEEAVEDEEAEEEDAEADEEAEDETEAEDEEAETDDADAEETDDAEADDEDAEAEEEAEAEDEDAEADEEEADEDAPEEGEPVDEEDVEIGEELTFEEGDTVEYQGNETTIAEVTDDEATLVWTGERTSTESVDSGENLTVGEEEELRVHIEGDTVQLTSDHASYDEQEDAIAAYEQRIDGITWVIVLSMLTVVILLSLAYLPVRG
ncbi:hypothetical protein [Natronorarus salvus]|uniref:hypothetical protein n=1 Tax=Natronorarus salvus TaxID=3117733 RepID=UPI002F265B9E